MVCPGIEEKAGEGTEWVWGRRQGTSRDLQMHRRRQKGSGVHVCVGCLDVPCSKQIYKRVAICFRAGRNNTVSFCL